MNEDALFKLDADTGKLTFRIGATEEELSGLKEKFVQVVGMFAKVTSGFIFDLSLVEITAEHEEPRHAECYMYRPIGRNGWCWAARSYPSMTIDASSSTKVLDFLDELNDLADGTGIPCRDHEDPEDRVVRPEDRNDGPGSRYWLDRQGFNPKGVS